MASEIRTTPGRSRASRSIEHRINFGDYEGVTVFVSASADCDEGEEERVLNDLADTLSEALKEEIRQARRFAIRESYIHDWE